MRAADITSEQSRAIYSRCPNICVSAAAGSGKTGVLARRYVRIIAETLAEQGDSSNPFSRILVITFTDKAAREMRARIASELGRSDLDALQNKLQDAYISTIHSFCARLLREYPLESALSPGFTVLSELEAARLLRASSMAVLDKVLASPRQFPEISSLISTMLRSRSNEGMNTLHAIAEEAERLLKAARGRGVGTLPLRRRITHSRESSSLTPGRQFAAEFKALKEAAALNGSEALYMASADAEQRLRQSPPQSLSGALQHARIALQRTESAYIPEAITDQRAELLKRLDEAIVVLEQEDASGIACLQMLDFVNAIVHEYDNRRMLAGSLDTEDLQLRCAYLLEGSPSIRLRCCERFRHIMVDEFQDTDPLQARIIEMLHPGLMEINREYSNTDVSQNSLFLVGDVRQSIYGFRGAEPGIFQQVQALFRSGATGYECIELTDNFRSRPELLEFTSLVFDTVPELGLPAPARMYSGRSFLANESGAPLIDLIMSQGLSRQQYGESEAEALAAYIYSLVSEQKVCISAESDPRFGEPIAWNDVMVLFRSLSDAEIWRAAFQRHGVPVQLPAVNHTMLQSLEVSDLIDALALIAYPNDDLALLTVLRSPFAGISASGLARIVYRAEKIPGNARTALIECLNDKFLTEPDFTACAAILEALHFCQQDRNSVRPALLLERMLRITQYEHRLMHRPGGAAMARNVRRFAELVAEEYFDIQDIASLVSTLREVQMLEGIDVGSDDNGLGAGVRFLTIHAAKGLEAPVTAIADLSRSLLARTSTLFDADMRTGEMGCKISGKMDAAYRQISDRKLEAEREEMKRLLYVGITRARERLILCGNLGRNRGFNWADMLGKTLGLQPDFQEGTQIVSTLPVQMHRHGQ